MARNLYIIRHGLIQANLDDVYAGRNDEELTEAGRKQAEETGGCLIGLNIRTVYSSPLKRAVQTAEAIAARTGADLVVDEDLIEMELGPWTGLTKDEVAAGYPLDYETWCTSPAELRLAGVEKVQEIQRRIVRAITRFLDQSFDSTAAMVTHAALIKCAHLYVNRLIPNSYHKVHVPNASVFRLTFFGGRSSLTRVR